MTRLQHRRFDVIGALLNAAGIVLLILGVDALSDSFRLGLAEIAAGLVLLAGLLVQQRTQRHPLVPMDLLRLRPFTLAFCTSICSYAAQATAYVSLPFYFQHGLGYNEVQTGLLITPWPAVIVFVAPLSGHLSDRYPAGILEQHRPGLPRGGDGGAGAAAGARRRSGASSGA